jgi:hypothetical protein
MLLAGMQMDRHDKTNKQFVHKMHLKTLNYKHAKQDRVPKGSQCTIMEDKYQIYFIHMADILTGRKTANLLRRHYLSKGFPVVDLSMISYGDDEVSREIIV